MFLAATDNTDMTESIGREMSTLRYRVEGEDTDVGAEGNRNDGIDQTVEERLRLGGQTQAVDSQLRQQESHPLEATNNPPARQ